jgi:aminotransferase EvaB
MTATTIPLFSAGAANASLDFLPAIKRVLDSHWYILGQEVAAFEQAFAEYCAVPHCISLANGTDALELALRALDIQAGDKVIVTANAGFYSSIAINLLGAAPLYVDIDPATLTLSVDRLKEALAAKPKAIIVTHLYGQLADIETIVALAQEKNIPVIEDCAQAHGAMRNQKRAGSFGAIACFSFYPTKNLGALGDGGAVITADATLATRLQQLRQYGWESKYHVKIAGGRNSRLDEIQAAILREKLPYLDGWNAERRRIASRYNEAFAKLSLICPPSVGDDYVAHLYVVRLQNRDSFRAYLKEQGVQTDVHYPIPDHLQMSPEEPVTLMATEEACEQVVSLPCFPGMPDASVEKVIEVVRGYFG